MTGLLIKDWKLMKMQKNFFLIILCLGMGMTVFSYDETFMIGFLTFVASLFTLSTISYDEFDNGNAFLFSLPVSRKIYTAEKYCFGFLTGGGAWLLATVWTLAVSAGRGGGAFRDILFQSLMIFSVMLVILGIMIPVQLKFGGEKGRIAILIGIGFLLLAGYGAAQLARAAGIDMEKLAQSFLEKSSGSIATVWIVLVFLILLISVKVSFWIMEKKEF